MCIFMHFVRCGLDIQSVGLLNDFAPEEKDTTKLWQALISLNMIGNSECDVTLSLSL